MSLIKTVFQFKDKLCLVIFIIIFSSISLFSLFFSFFLRYCQYRVAPGGCYIFCFTCPCNKDCDSAKISRGNFQIFTQFRFTATTDTSEIENELDLKQYFQ